MSNPFPTREERQAMFNETMDKLTADLQDRVELMVNSDPVLSKEVEVERTLGHSRLDSIKISFKESRITDDDRVWRTICSAEWKRSYHTFHITEMKMVVRQSGYDRNKVSHASYKIRQDKTINIEKIVDRMREMTWAAIQTRDHGRIARKERAATLKKVREMFPDFTFDGRPCKFNDDREFQVGETYGNNINVRADSDGSLSVTLKLRDISESKVKELIALLEEHTMNESDES